MSAHEAMIAFQSLGRDSVGFSRLGMSADPRSVNSFNPSVGILWGLAKAIDIFGRGRNRFQSLGRDSVGFSPMASLFPHLNRLSFNPSVGILWGLAQSRFRPVLQPRCFNPSVGILWGLAGGLAVSN